MIDRGSLGSGPPGRSKNDAGTRAKWLIAGRVAQPVSHSKDDAAHAIEVAIDRLTRAFETATDEGVIELVRERRAMREELRAIRESGGGVVVLADRRVPTRS